MGGELYRKYSARGNECGAANRDWGYDRSSSKTLQHRRRLTVTEIPEPPRQVGRDLPEHLRKADATGSATLLRRVHHAQPKPMDLVAA